MSEEDLEYEADLNENEDMEISFDDAPPQVKPTVTATAPKAKPAPRALPKPAPVRKPKVAKTATATAKTRKQHRVDTIDKNRLTAYLDKITNDEGYAVLSVTGSSSIMGSFDIVSVKN